MSSSVGSVYFGVKTVLGTDTKRKHQMAKKTCLKLLSKHKAAERWKTPNKTGSMNSAFSTFSKLR